MMASQYKVLLIGVGGFGKRYFEGILKSPLSLKLFVVDKNPEILSELSRTELSETKTVHFLTDYHAVENNIDLCIISTTATHRFAIFSDLLSQNKSKSYILEKVVFQQYSHFEKIDRRLETLHLKPSIWVSHARRYMKEYQDIQSYLLDKTIQKVSIEGFNWNMGSNLVHMLDLTQFLTNTYFLDFDLSLITKIKESKRAGYMDMFGSLQGKLKKDITLEVSNTPSEIPSIKFDIFFDGGKIRINESEKKVIYDSEIKKTSDIDVFTHSRDFHIILQDILENNHSN